MYFVNILCFTNLQVKLTVFWQYMKAVGLVTSLVICFLYGCQNAAAIGANVWLSDWTNEPVINGTQHNTSMRVGVYAALGLLQGKSVSPVNTVKIFSCTLAEQRGEYWEKHNNSHRGL